jgi:Holliday junction resolvase RusA-like endonuclease
MSLYQNDHTWKKKEKADMRLAIYSAMINIDALPKVRMTQGSKWSAPAKRYLAYQEALAWEMKTIGRGMTGINVPVILCYEIFLPHKRLSDIDNLQKGIADALQRAGILTNDNLIEGIVDSYIYRGTSEGKVYIELYKRA